MDWACRCNLAVRKKGKSVKQLYFKDGLASKRNDRWSCIEQGREIKHFKCEKANRFLKTVCYWMSDHNPLTKGEEKMLFKYVKET